MATEAVGTEVVPNRAAATHELGPRKRSLLAALSAKYEVGERKLLDTFKATIFTTRDGVATDEEIISFLAVAHRYDLDPFRGEIFAFRKKGESGGIQPIVSIDGWSKIANREEQYDGCELVENLDEKGVVVSLTCRVYRKDRSHPMVVTEYMSECKGTSIPWQRWPIRMLRHKAFVQGIRLAFSITGIVDPDEADRIRYAETIEGDRVDTGTGEIVSKRPETLDDVVAARRAASQEPEAQDQAPDPGPAVDEAPPAEAPANAGADVERKTGPAYLPTSYDPIRAELGVAIQANEKHLTPDESAAALVSAGISDSTALEDLTVDQLRSLNTALGRARAAKATKAQPAGQAGAAPDPAKITKAARLKLLSDLRMQRSVAFANAARACGANPGSSVASWTDEQQIAVLRALQLHS